MEIAYCERWWLARKSAVGPMSEESARKRHESRKPYVALLGGAQQPHFVVDLAGEWVSVYFLDTRLRKYLSYQFKEVQPTRLFLKGAVYWDFEGDAEVAHSKRIFNFSENGHIVMSEENRATGEVREFETDSSVAENWDSYPAFGEYAPLCKKERVSPAGAT